MKGLRKIISVILSVMLLAVSFTVGVTAAEPTGTITLINNKAETNVSIAGKEYTAYKIFNLVQNDEHSTYAYTLNEGFKGLFGSDEFKSVFSEVTVDETKTSTIYKFVSELNAADVEKFANVVYKFIEADKVGEEVVKKTVVATDEEKAVFEELELGYYIIYGSGTSVDNSKDVVTACALDTTTWDTESSSYSVTIDVKVGVPTVDKNIVENKGNDDEELVKADSESIGDTVDFRVTSSVPDLTGYEKYTFVMTDTMSKGLTFNNDIVVKIGTDTIDSENYIVVYNKNDTTGETTITVTFNDFYTLITTSEYTQGTNITFDYSAKINSDAVIGAEGNPNTAKITYSNNPHADTTNDTNDTIVKVYTFKFNIYKYTNVGTANTPLAGAEFELKENGVAEPIKFVNLTNGNYRVATDEDTNTVTTIVSSADGNIIITGLGEGDYILTETKAPAGYNLLEADIEVKITPEYSETDAKELTALTEPAENAAYTNLTDNSGIKSDIENTTGTELPSTGGMGTTILYIIGGLLIAIAFIGFTVKKIAKKAE